MRVPATAVLMAAALGVALAGCGDDDSDPGDPTPGTGTTSPGAAAGPVASCVVGDWRSTGASAEIGGDPAALSASGGAGVGLTVGEDGAASLDLSGMEPLEFTGEVAGAELRGELTYTGRADTTIRTGGDEPAGDWEPTTEVNWDDVRLTVQLAAPVEARPFDDVPIGEYAQEADEWTADLVDVDPVLGEGEYECRDDTLVLGPTGDEGLVWTFERG